LKAIENIPKVPMQKWAEFQSWARGDFEEKSNLPKKGTMNNDL